MSASNAEWIAQGASALLSLDDDEKGVGNTDTLGGTQEMVIISEPGVYALVMRLRKPQAKGSCR